MVRAALPPLVLAVIAIVVSGVGCSDGPTERAPTPAASAPASCAADERATPEGICALFATSDVCTAGSRPAVGTEGCVAVGPTSCAAGFEKDASGWGCAPVLPAAPCTGATRPRLGDRECASVGDCAAPFPPAGAIVVDPALADGALDATHVRTLRDALAVAADGATLALVDGAHVTDAMSVTKAVTIAGRCASKVHLAPAAGGGPGLELRSKATLRGLTLDAFASPLVTSGVNAALIVDEVVIERARSRAVFASNGSAISLRRSVVRGTAPLGASDQTVAVLAGTGGKITLEETAILSSTDAAVAATDSPASRVALSRCVVQGTLPRPDGVAGGALRAFEGAHLDVTESAILGSTGSAILAFRRKAPPPEVTVSRSVIGGTVPTEETGTAIATAVNAAYDAVVRIDESTVSDSQGIALYAAERAKIGFSKSVVVRVTRSRDLSAHGGSAIKGAELTLEDSAVVGVGALGVGVWDGGHARVSRSLVRDIGGDILDGLPMGMGFNANLDSTMDILDSAVVDALEVSVSATNRSVVKLDHVLISRSSTAAAPRFGHGILSVDSATFSIGRSIIERQGGVGLFFSSGGGVIERSLVRDNAVGAHVQEASSLVEADVAPEAVPAQYLVVTKNTAFVGNATRIGSGVLPLPSPLAAP